MLRLGIAGADSGPPLLLHEAPGCEVWRDAAGIIGAYGYSAAEAHWMYLPGIAAFRFDDKSPEVTAFPDSAEARDLVEDAFRRTVLPMALQARGYEALHASAVCGPRGVVSFCGRGETGKSTLAYGLSQRGYRLWADDAVVLEFSSQSVSTIPLPFRIRLLAASISFLGQPPPGMGGSGPRDSKPQPLASVCVLERVSARAGAPVKIVPLSSASALTAVLTHAYCFDPHDVGRKRRMMEHYLELLAAGPVFRVRFQAGLEKLPAILDTIERAILA